MIYRKDDRLGQLKDEMKANLIEINETKNKLLSKESNFKQKVEKFSEKIDDIIQRKQERELTKIKDYKLMLEI